MLARVKLLLCAAVLLAGVPALASVGRTWTTSGTQEFAAGKLEGVSVLSTGEVQLAPQMAKLEGLKAGFIWDVAAADDGTVYVATGSPGAVYKVEGGKAQLFHQSDQDNVLSVLPMPDGSVLAGTAPRGIIMRISRGGAAEVFARLPDAYVWGMALGPANEVFVATGPNGRLLQLDRAGQVTERLKVKQRNLMCVAVDADGNAYAGTEPDGYIYCLPREGKATVIYDADESEVHSLLISSQGTVPPQVVIYAATAQGRSDGRPEQPPQPGPSGPGGPGGASADSSQAGPVPAPTTMPAAPSAPNSVYRIVPGQGAMRVLRLDRMGVLSLGLAGNRLLIGTGPGGRIFALDEDGVSRILAQVDSPHVTAIAVLPNGDAVIGASNSGALWSMKNDVNERGAFYSKPFDGEYLSRWATVKWQGRAGAGQDVRIKLRTGNSAEPDETWSDWSEWATQASGQQVKAPMGRFAQFGAALSARPRAESPALVAVEVSYLQANRKPLIDDITVNGVSVLKTDRRAVAGPPSGPSGPTQPGRSARRTADRTIAWKASDPNDDELIYDLYYRGMDAAQWQLIKKDATETTLTWDTSRVPDGFYQLRLVAGDRPERPASDAQADTRVSFPVLIDNRPPDAADLQAVRQSDGAYKLSGRAVDSFSAIKQVQVSDNAGDWHPVFPSDGLLDSPQEAFSFTTGVLAPGEHVFVFAVTDSNDNAGSGKVIVEVGAPAK